MPLYRLDREGEAKPDGAIPVYTEWMGGPSLAAIRNCPVAGFTGRRTARITSEPDTYFSQPAFITVKGKRLTGYITGTDTGYEFRPLDSETHKLY